MLGNFPPKNPTEQKLLRKLSPNLKVSLKFHVPENRNHPFKQWLVLNSSLLRSRYVYRQATWLGLLLLKTLPYRYGARTGSNTSNTFASPVKFQKRKKKYIETAEGISREMIHY